MAIKRKLDYGACIMFDRIIMSHRVRRDLVEALRLHALRSGLEQRVLIERALEAAIDPATLIEGAEIARRRMDRDRKERQTTIP